MAFDRARPVATWLAGPRKRRIRARRDDRIGPRSAPEGPIPAAPASSLRAAAAPHSYNVAAALRAYMGRHIYIKRNPANVQVGWSSTERCVPHYELRI